MIDNSILSTVDIYDSKQNTWISTEMGSQRTNFAANNIGELVFFINGESNNGKESSYSMDVYDCVNEQWSTIYTSFALTYHATAILGILPVLLRYHINIIIIYY